MEQNTKDVIDVIAKLAGLIAVAAGILTFRHQLLRSREDRARATDEQRRATAQRKDELRWKQAQAAKELNDEMLEDSQVATAFRVLDYPSAPVEVDGKDVPVSSQQILDALDPQLPARDPVSRTIREGFDALFYYLAIMEHYVASSLILPDDVAYPLDYYFWHFERLRGSFEAYTTWFGLARAGKFLEDQRRRLSGTQRPPAFQQMNVGE